MLSPSSSTTTKNIYDIGSIELRESYIEPGIPFAAGIKYYRLRFNS